ncbi:MAG: SpoVG family protein [Firmicutes bacterium]|nr:SpoVG family protein [Bacillota bacterium]
MEIQVQKLHLFREQEGHARAICDVVLGGAWALHGVRVMEGEKGPFVALPARPESDGSYREYAHPVTAEAREALSKAVLGAYEKARARAHEREAAGALER